MDQGAFAMGHCYYGTMKTVFVKLINCLDFKASVLNQIIHSPKICKGICGCAPQIANLKKIHRIDIVPI